MKRDFEALEKRRLKAVRLVEKKNINQAEVARRLHVSRQRVSRWMKDFRAGGEKALQKASRAGRKPELTEDNRALLKCLLDLSPEELGFESAVWTSTNVADLIAQEFGIEYHRGHVWKILKQLGWSRQLQQRTSPDGASGRKQAKPFRAADESDRLDRKFRRILEEMAGRQLSS